jgi:hypothetical protein
VDIEFDSALFDSTSQIRITDRSGTVPEGFSGGTGYAEVVLEFMNRTSPRAKDYMNWFMTRIAKMPPSKQTAELASKFIELSILLHPKNSELAFPVDVVQLKGGGSVDWVWVKPNCQKN